MNLMINSMKNTVLIPFEFDLLSILSSLFNTFAFQTKFFRTNDKYNKKLQFSMASSGLGLFKLAWMFKF